MGLTIIVEQLEDITVSREVKTMRALQYFPTVEDPNTRRSLFEVLQRILMGTDVVKNVNKNNASHAVLFEALALSVEEAECQKTYELDTFDRSKPPEEATLREAHEDAVQKSMATFNTTAFGAGLVWQKYEKRLQSFLKKAFESSLHLEPIVQSLINFEDVA